MKWNTYINTYLHITGAEHIPHSYSVCTYIYSINFILFPYNKNGFLSIRTLQNLQQKLADLISVAESSMSPDRKPEDGECTMYGKVLQSINTLSKVPLVKPLLESHDISPFPHSACIFIFPWVISIKDNYRPKIIF